VYDFNGAKAYNIMVLHKDNTIEMYNLKGRKPSSWKTIAAPETIKSLPEDCCRWQHLLGCEDFGSDSYISFRRR
jgi:hypothetical protein